MKVVGSIEARMGATRLPGKVLMPVFQDMPLLELVVRRFERCREVDGLVVATTVSAGDDAIADWCERHDVPVFRGSEDDVLDRVAKAAASAGADAVVQMGADSAYLDFGLIDQLVSLFRAGEYDFVCNTLTLTYPLGIYGHVVRTSCLTEINARDDLTAADREDVTRYIWEHPDGYAIENVTAPDEFKAPEIRLTIDYPEDLALARRLYDEFGRWDITTRDIIALYRAQPEIFADTMKLEQKSAPHLSAVAGTGR